MLNRILEFSLNNRLLVLLAGVILSLSGLFLSSRMNVDVFPDLTAPTVTVLTEVHGLESVEVEKLVTFQIETAMNGAPDVRRIRSSSAAGISIVWVEFEWGTDVFRARQVVSERLPAVRENLPREAGEPTLAPVASIMGEIMLLAIRSDSLSPMELRTLAEWVVAPHLKSIGGIANVIVIGGEYKQYQVLADPVKLLHYEVSLEELQQAVSDAHLNSTGGIFNEFGNQYQIKGEGRVSDILALENALVRSVNGQPIHIGDVAELKIGAADKIGDGSMNASPAVIMTITKQPQVNTLMLTEQIDQAVDELKNTLPRAVQIESRVFRQADFINASIQNLKKTLWEGALFVVLVLFVFLWNWRTTVISLLAIPLSLLVSVIVLKMLGYTINTMSLGGMAIAIGALVDDAVIDVENVFKRLRQNAALPAEQRQPILTVVREASFEIRSSIIIATLIIIVSFVPLFFLSGMEGRLLAPLGIAFISSVVTSLIVAVTITPVLCSYLLSSQKRLEKQSEGTRMERWLTRRYSGLLTRSLARSGWVIGITVTLFAGSLLLFFGLGRSFLPEFNEGSLVISAVGPPAMSLEESNRAGRRIEELLLELPEVNKVTRRTGRSELDEHAMGVNAAEIDAPFSLAAGEGKAAFLDRVRHKLSVIPGINITIGQPISHRIDHMLSGTRANIAIKIFGPELDRLFSLGKEVTGIARGIPGLVDVSVEQQVEVPQVRITPRRTMLAGYGMTASDLLHYIEDAMAGKIVGQVFEGQQHFDLVVRYQEEYRGSMEKIRNLRVPLRTGGVVPLTEVADISSVSSPNRISREGVQRKVVVSANVHGRDLRGAVSALQEAIDRGIVLPENYRIEYGGQFESEARASGMLLVTAILASLIIYVLLYFEFRDPRLAAVVLLNLPMALIGGILILYVSSATLSIAATIGFISLFGIATRNGILLVSRYEDLRSEGFHGSDLLVRGALERLNPILMTALTTGLALIPLALSGEAPGNEIQSPMAVVILGGLFSATLLNLLVIPAIYGWMLRKYYP